MRKIPAILGEIVEYKREFVRGRKHRIPQADLEKCCIDAEPARGFADALRGDGCALIAEIKTASPSRGLIRQDFDVAEIARLYAHNGASCISVLTDEKYFMGSLERIAAAREASPLPVLRKDFVVDAYQIFESRCAGADAVLLIAACLGDDEMEDFMEIAVRLGMDTIVEVHDEREMERIASLETKLVGVNNRDLTTFHTDIETTGRLAQYAPPQALLVSESGIHTAGDVRQVWEYGARAVLVGEAIMRENDIPAKVRELARAATVD